MPVIEPEDTSLKDLKGLHLWHGDLSSCSQRVRITLAEKDLNWESHVISIPKNEHATPAYQAINPKGLVPAFVHDGVTMIESKDIIRYLDETYPEPPLRPAGPEKDAEMQAWLDRADKAQSDLKLLSHEFLFRGRKPMTAEDVEEFAAAHRNQVLVDFIREWAGTGQLPKDKVDAAVNRTNADFNRINAAVGDQDWILGDAIALADIAWMPNVHRMWLMDWPLDRYPNLLRWFEQVKARPGYQKGLADWEPDGAAERFQAYVAERDKSGIHVRNYGALAA